MSVLQHYEKALASGALVEDAGQRTLIIKLDALAETLNSSKNKGFFARLFGNSGGVCGLYVWSGVGRGKTMLMDMFFAELHSAKKRRVHFHGFMQEVHKRIFAARQQHPDADALLLVADDLAGEAKILCFDEMAVTDVADAMILARLFTRLFEKGVTVIATSNMSPDALYKDGLNRPLFEPFIALLQQKTEVFHLDEGQDYRLARLSQSGVWFEGEERHDRLEQAFIHLTAGQLAKSEEIELNGRKLHVPRASGGAAFLTFAELCEAPLGAEDYLELARHYHTLFIAEVPRFTTEMRGPLRRFINLIDILYDAGVNLVASAKAAPQNLISDIDGYEKFGFERTASRLIEMRSENYLKRAHEQVRFSKP